jgi:hypothetical protein
MYVARPEPEQKTTNWPLAKTKQTGREISYFREQNLYPTEKTECLFRMLLR